MTRRAEAREVSVRRVRRGNQRVPKNDREVFMLGLPRVGHAMEIFGRRGKSVHLTSTSCVQRVLVTFSGLVAFVETFNSVYRLAFAEPVVL